jgi:hypothetical protein
MATEAERVVRRSATRTLLDRVERWEGPKDIWLVIGVLLAALPWLAGAFLLGGYPWTGAVLLGCTVAGIIFVDRALPATPLPRGREGAVSGETWIAQGWSLLFTTEHLPR